MSPRMSALTATRLLRNALDTPGGRYISQGFAYNACRPRVYSVYLSKTRQQLVPPKPNEFDMTRSTGPS